MMHQPGATKEVALLTLGQHSELGLLDGYGREQEFKNLFFIREGLFLDGRLNGYGAEYLLLTNQYYIGHFKNGKKHGTGCLTCVAFDETGE